MCRARAYLGLTWKGGFGHLLTAPDMFLLLTLIWLVVAKYNLGGIFVKTFGVLEGEHRVLDIVAEANAEVGN